MSGPQELLAMAAGYVVDDGMEYAAAKCKAGQALRHRGALPSNGALEDAVREHIAVFHGDEQPAELRALRELALQWMQRFSPMRPHLAGAVWRGTATRRSAVMLDLYCDDPKSAEIMLLDQGMNFEAGPGGPPTRDGQVNDVLTLLVPSPALQQRVLIHLFVRDLDDLRGALKPDDRGRTWRGDAVALRRLLDTEAGGRP